VSERKQSFREFEPRQSRGKDHEIIVARDAKAIVNRVGNIVAAETNPLELRSS
jgi:hypothetical protein